MPKTREVRVREAEEEGEEEDFESKTGGEATSQDTDDDFQVRFCGTGLPHG
jgi:hypothetical protein